MTDKNSISFGYQADLSGTDEENKFLKESIENLEQELEKFRRTPLISCEIRDVLKDKALIRLPNGNEFFVEISENCEKLTVGDHVLAEQKNLTIVKKLEPSHLCRVIREQPLWAANRIASRSLP